MHGLLESSGHWHSKHWGSIREQSTHGGDTELGHCKIGHKLPVHIFASSLQDGLDEDFWKSVYFPCKLPLLLAFAFIPFEFCWASQSFPLRSLDK